MGRIRLVAVVALSVVGLIVAGVAGAAGNATPFRVLVVKATWGPQPFTDDDVDTVMQGVEQFYATGSFGKAAISYVQTPWLDVMSGPLSCADEDAQLPQTAASAGWNPASYDRVVYLVPYGNGSGCVNSAFHGAGIGTIMNTDVLPVGAVIHELGHSFGMGHAGLLTCWYVQKKRLCSANPVATRLTCGRHGQQQRPRLRRRLRRSAESARGLDHTDLHHQAWDLPARAG